jgi:hypothetical protein
MFINVERDGKKHKDCLIQTPWMFNPFGMTTSMKTDDNAPSKYYLELSFGTAPTAYVEDFHQKLTNFDQLVRSAAVTNCRQWLSVPELDDEYCDEFYKPIVRVYKNKDKVATGDYPDTLKFKIPYYLNEDGNVSFGNLEVYNAKKEKQDFTTIDELKNLIGRSNRVRAIVKAHSVWQSGKEFGVSWQVQRIQILGGDSNVTDCQIVGGDNSDEESY